MINSLCRFSILKQDFRNTQSITCPPARISSSDVGKILLDGLSKVEENINLNSYHMNPVIKQFSDHSLKSGGKRTRARFVLLSHLLFNENLSNEVIDIATAAELFHTATLLHDDVIDGAELRRGRETVNHKWGSKTAVIMGDFLLSKAFKLLLKINSMPIIESFIETAKDLGEGALTEQVYQDDMNLSEDLYFFIISRKTASFFRTCASTGAILSKRSDQEIKHLREFGHNFGIAFQITDDLMDVMSDESTMGKPRGQDILEGHLTLPLIRYFAQDSSHLPAKKLSELSPTDKEFETILEGVNSDGSLSYSFTKASEYIEKALKSLSHFKKCPAQTFFENHASDLIKRKS